MEAAAADKAKNEKMKKSKNEVKMIEIRATM